MDGKQFWKSKTFWVNLIGAGTMALQSQYGFVIPAEVQVGLLAVVNMGLRAITKEPIAWQ